MNTLENWLELPIDEIKKGYKDNSRFYECLICGREVEKGIVYKDRDKLYEASKFMEMHITRVHGSVFEFLLGLDRRVTGLSEHQGRLLRCFYNRVPDQMIKEQLGIGSISTIRNHRFSFKEKERQAKIFMTIMELISENENCPDKYLLPHATATMVDDRYKITPEENDRIQKKYFPDGLDARLKTFHIKEKCKLVVLRHIINSFEVNRKYPEKEVNEILKNIYDDYVTIRRYLIEYGFMDREKDCSIYWRCI